MTICNQDMYFRTFQSLSILSTYLPFLVLYVFKGSMTKIEPSTFHNEHHFGLEDSITSLTTKIAYFLNAFNQVKIQVQMKFSIVSWKVIWIAKQNIQANLFSVLPKTGKPQARVEPLCASVSPSEKRIDTVSSLIMFLQGQMR